MLELMLISATDARFLGIVGGGVLYDKIKNDVLNEEKDAWSRENLRLRFVNAQLGSSFHLA